MKCIKTGEMMKEEEERSEMGAEVIIVIGDEKNYMCTVIKI